MRMWRKDNRLVELREHYHNEMDGLTNAIRAMQRERERLDRLLLRQAAEITLMQAEIDRLRKAE